MTQPYTIGTTSIDAKMVFQRLITTEPGDVVTYQELNQITGRDVVKNRHIIATARNMAAREKLMQFDAVKNVGLKRLSDDEIVAMQTTRPLNHIRSTVRRSVKALACANQISNESLIAKNAALSLMGAIATFVKPKAIETVSKQTQQAEIGSGKVMELFK